MSDLANKTLFITGASRGTGKAIALRAAQDGANIAIAAKTKQPHPKLPGTIDETAAEVTQAGGRALACKVDIRFEDQIQEAVARAVAEFGGIDIVVNNASAISLTGTAATSPKLYDRMFDVNARGSYFVTQACLPFLLKASNPQVLNISPPLNLAPKWFRNFAAYTLAKYAMSFWVLGMSAELGTKGVAVNALWPRTTIATAAVLNLLGGEAMIPRCRKPEIMADAAHAILKRDARTCSGNFFIDEDVLAAEGVDDLTPYAVDPASELATDLFLD
ncbi:MAG: NAD(P)-dependent oxidoreductase [bacterium]